MVRLRETARIGSIVIGWSVTSVALNLLNSTPICAIQHLPSCFSDTLLSRRVPFDLFERSMGFPCLSSFPFSLGKWKAPDKREKTTIRNSEPIVLSSFEFD